MNYCEIKTHDIANGVGVRVSLFVAGCSHHCPGCFNPETWDFNAGKQFDKRVIDKIIQALEPYYINGLTLLGGEPFEMVNQRGLLPLIRKVKEIYPEKDIWSFTGFVYDRDLVPGGRAYCEVTDEFLDSLSVLVDGPFVEVRKDISLKFRGSSNQRLIDMPATRKKGEVVLWE